MVSARRTPRLTVRLPVITEVASIADGSVLTHWRSASNLSKHARSSSRVNAAIHRTEDGNAVNHEEVSRLVVVGMIDFTLGELDAT